MQKTTEHKAVVQGVEPKIVTIPMHQHIGAPCDPIVEVGDYVKVGQRLVKPLLLYLHRFTVVFLVL